MAQKLCSNRLLTGLLICCLSLSLRPAAANSQEAPQLAFVPEAVLRNLAKTVVMPLYPEASKRKGAKGLAVARIDLNENGEMSDIRIVEAPDDNIKLAVINAIKQWKFTPAFGNGKPLRLRGKLTFYFRLDGGQARVENPRQFNNAKVENR
jgi:TonB family protein